MERQASNQEGNNDQQQATPSQPPKRVKKGCGCGKKRN
jgi:hypothetical protein